MQPEVVFFCGPPCAGKTLVYTHHFSQTHERISPRELFEADPSLSLRAVILKVVNVVKKGQSVVLDDENSTKKTRKSYLNILINKVPQCGYRAVHFHVSPSDGLFLCQWAREWELAHHFESVSSNIPLKENVKDVECWFERTNEPPDKEEGFTKINKVEVQLICETSFKFVVPGLFLQWEGLFQDEGDEQCKVQMTVDIIKRWSHCNPYGRVIVLQLNEKKACNDGKCEYVVELKQCISELATQAAIPLFFVHLCAVLWTFHRPPNPGIFAWLQRLHNIDLSNRATFYVYSSESHQKAAGAAGVKCIKASKLLHNPQMINAVHCGLTAQVPECVRKAKLAWFDSQSRPAASVPLFQRAVTSHNATNAHDMPPQCVTVISNQRVHGVCYKDLETLRSFNSRYQHVAVPTEPASSELFNNQDCQTSEGNSSTGERKHDIPSGVPSDESEASKLAGDKHPVSSTMDQPAVVGPISPSHLVKNLTRKDIENLASSAGHFRRGEGCERLIRDVSTSVEQDGVLFTAKCLGSQGQLYDVSTLLCLKGILQANCSCADPASKVGKCKHVVALLLRCKNEQNMKNVSKPSIPLDKSNLEHGTGTAAKVKELHMACQTPASGNNSMKWTEDHDLTLCGEVLLQEPFKHPRNSKERGEVWGQIALDLNSLASPIFKVSKRSVRDRLTLLQTKYKEKIREERASGIDCEETQLDAAVEEILDKEKAADMERNEQAGTLTKKHQSEKASAEEVRRQAMERLGKTQKRNADSEEGKPSKRGKRRSSDAVEYLKEKFELESKLRKDEMEFKKNEQQMLMDQQSQMHKQQLEMMKMVQQQNQTLMALLEKATFTK